MNESFEDIYVNVLV